VSFWRRNSSQTARALKRLSLICELNQRLIYTWTEARHSGWVIRIYVDSEALKSADEISSISSSITIVGKISGTGTVRICGHIEGELRASTVLIDDGAQVEGDIVAEELIIGGGVKGTIHANRVKLNGSAIVEGDIFHRSLSIDENARFEGSSRREETVTDAPRIPISQLEAQADVDTVVAMEGSRKHNGPLENKWRANE
jgi:cytoskeletal protein CcmA (bactofilin family)